MAGLAHTFEAGQSLAHCSVCGAGEGELLKWCPGHRLTSEALEACYTGNVVDLDYYRARREYEERERAEEQW